MEKIFLNALDFMGMILLKEGGGFNEKVL